ncbi:hypothetical protein [Streptomyces sp. Ac-502]|uniref:hypothetical protein n=1 Tax=Streptomyces sp. Ac-502 TaxID=3342801 RepID=UPI00386240A2
MPNTITAATPSWVGGLNTSLEALRAGAERARTAADAATTAAECLVRDAENMSDDSSVMAATVQCEGYDRTHLPSVLRQVAYAHHRMALELSWIWHRAARAYAYGLAQALTELKRGQSPDQAHIREDFPVPAPPGKTGCSPSPTRPPTPANSP